MPTISEPTWQEREERQKQVIKDYIEAKHNEIDDSVDVLRARLFALGMRGEDLRLYLQVAQCEKWNHRNRNKLSQGELTDPYTTSVIWLRDRRK